MFLKVFKTKLWTWMKASISLYQKQSCQFYAQFSRYTYLWLLIAKFSLPWRDALIVQWKDCCGKNNFSSLQRSSNQNLTNSKYSSYSSLTNLKKITVCDQTRNMSFQLRNLEVMHFDFLLVYIKENIEFRIQCCQIAAIA